MANTGRGREKTPPGEWVDDYAPLAAIDPATFFATSRLRRVLGAGIAVTRLELGRRLGAYSADDDTLLDFELSYLRAWGLVERRPILVASSGEPVLAQSGEPYRKANAIRLTTQGRASLRWVAPPRHPSDDLRRWAGRLAAAIAQHHVVDLHAMLGALDPGPHRIARARLCTALHLEGWPDGAVDLFFGFRAGLAAASRAEWRTR